MKVIVRLPIILFSIVLLTTQLLLPVSAQTGTLLYTALGDSLAFGLFDAFEAGGYVPRFRAFAEAEVRQPVAFRNLAVNGWTSSQLLNALRTDSNFRNSVAQSRIVTWDIGGNDFLRVIDSYRNRTCGGTDNQDCLRSAVATFKTNWVGIISEILSLRSTQDTIIRTMDIYNPFVNAGKASDSWPNDGGLNDFQATKPYLDDVNRYIAITATANNIPYARVYEAFNGPNGDEDAGSKGYIAFDGVHPNERGHRVIADLFRGLAYVPVVVPANTLQLSAPMFQVIEDNARATITVTRTGDTRAAAAVDYITVDNPAVEPCDPTVAFENRARGAAFARCDYATTVDTLRFAPGETEKTLTIPVIDDVHVEETETFQVALSNPVGATLGERGTATIQIFDNDPRSAPNPVYHPPFFVRMQYLDFLSREPEPGGFDAWVGVLNRCNNTPDCDRIEVSASFFRSEEFQLKGYFVYRFYKVSFGRLPRYAEIIPDMRRVTGQTGDEVEAKRIAFTNEWVTRQSFRDIYNSLSDAAFVDKLVQTAGVTLTGAVTRDTLVSDLQNRRKTRADVLRAIVEHPDVDRKEYNGAFVAMQYFGYLRRDPEQAGYDAWLRVINRGDSYRVMVDGFVNSTEYRSRFGQP